MPQQNSTGTLGGARIYRAGRAISAQLQILPPCSDWFISTTGARALECACCRGAQVRWPACTSDEQNLGQIGFSQWTIMGVRRFSRRSKAPTQQGAQGANRAVPLLDGPKRQGWRHGMYHYLRFRTPAAAGPSRTHPTYRADVDFPITPTPATRPLCCAPLPGSPIRPQIVAINEH